MDIEIEKNVPKINELIYLGIPIEYKRHVNLPNKSTFRDFYPYELRPNEKNLDTLREALNDIINGKFEDKIYHLSYCGVDYKCSTGDMVEVFRLLIGRNIGEVPRADEVENGPHALILDPLLQEKDSYGPIKEGEYYYRRSSVLIPTDYLIERFISIEERYIGDFDYHFGFPVSLLAGLFAFDNKNDLYPPNIQKLPKEVSLKKAAEFFMYTPFSLKNFSGVSAFMESVTRMILMDIIDMAFFYYRKDFIALTYSNKIESSEDSTEMEKEMTLYLNIALDYLYMAFHSNYYATGTSQDRYIRLIRDKYIDYYTMEEGDVKFADPAFGFHPETVASYALYPFLSMIYSGFLCGFSPTIMINFGETVSRALVGKQLRWFRYSWPYVSSYGSIGFYWGSLRGKNMFARHNLIYFAKHGAFNVTPADIEFLKKVFIVPLEEFLSDFAVNEEIRKRVTEKDKNAAVLYLEYLKRAIDWMDLRISDEDLNVKYPEVYFVWNRRKIIKWSNEGNGMVEWLKGILSPYIENHIETEYSPFPHLFSNRGLFKHYFDPYVFSEKDEDIELFEWKELEFYKKVFEKNPMLFELSERMSLLSLPLAQAVDERRFNILVDDDRIGVGAVTRLLSDYFFAGFNPRLPFRALPAMTVTAIDWLNYFVPSAETGVGSEKLEIPFEYRDRNTIHLGDLLDISEKLGLIAREIPVEFTESDILKKLEDSRGDLMYYPFAGNYYYNLASNSGNFFYDGSRVTDINTGATAPLYIQSMDRVMFSGSYEAELDRVYLKSLPPSWFDNQNANEPRFKSKELFEALDKKKLFKDGFASLCVGDVRLMADDDAKARWSMAHNGQSPNAYDYCEGI
ncbi:MAG: hypothetical protein QXV17_11950 [Candidatus Micrarchaeaceae archaeon]